MNPRKSTATDDRREDKPVTAISLFAKNQTKACCALRLLEFVPCPRPCNNRSGNYSVLRCVFVSVVNDTAAGRVKCRITDCVGFINFTLISSFWFGRKSAKRMLHFVLYNVGQRIKTLRSEHAFHCGTQTRKRN